MNSRKNAKAPGLLSLALVVCLLLAACSGPAKYAGLKEVRDPEASKAFRAFLSNKQAALDGEKEYRMEDLVEQEIRENDYLFEDPEAVSGENVTCTYLVLPGKEKDYLLVDLKVSDVSSGHSLYQIGYTEHGPVIEQCEKLGWSDYVTCYSTGVVAISHGQHLPAFTVYADIDRGIRTLWSEGDAGQALLIEAGPADWVDGELLEQCRTLAETVIIWEESDDPEETEAKIEKVLGFSLEDNIREPEIMSVGK